MSIVPSPSNRTSATLDGLLRRADPLVIPDRFPWPPTIEGLRGANAKLQGNAVPRDELVDILVRGNERHGNPEGARLAARLGSQESRVLFTGQQPGLFGGPLMVFAKIAGAVRWAQRIEEALGVPVIPVYWSASEDHDLEEVNRLDVHEGLEITRRRAPIEDEGLALEQIAVTPEVVAFARDALKATGWSATDAVLAAREGESWPAWTTRILVKTLEGLPFVVAEPSWFRFLLGPLFRRCVHDVEVISEALNTGTTRVVELGFEPQVRTPDPSVLFFVGGTKERRRVRYSGRWSIDGNDETWSTAEFAERVGARPEDFSVNVVARPLVQQFAFPVLGHVNGPAENAYFAQYKEIFVAMDLSIPVALPRPRVTFLREKDIQLMESLGLELEHLLVSPETWPEAPAEPWSLGDLIEATRAKFETIVSEFRPHVDDRLNRAVESFGTSLQQALDKLERTLSRDREQREGVGRDRRRRLSQWVSPRNRPQERVLGILSLLKGFELGVLGRLLSDVDPSDLRHQFLILEEGLA